MAEQPFAAGRGQQKEQLRILGGLVNIKQREEQFRTRPSEVQRTARIKEVREREGKEEEIRNAARENIDNTKQIWLKHPDISKEVKSLISLAQDENDMLQVFKLIQEDLEPDRADFKAMTDEIRFKRAKLGFEQDKLEAQGKGKAVTDLGKAKQDFEAGFITEQEFNARREVIIGRQYDKNREICFWNIVSG